VARGAAGRRYAKALFLLASESNTVEVLRGELDAFAKLLDDNQELAGVLLQPLYPVEQRRAVLQGVAAKAGASALLRQFYQVLIDHRRLIDFVGIRDEFARLADEQRGLERATVRSARPLTDAQVERLKRTLGARIGRDVAVEVVVDPNLLGGLVAQVGDVVFDGSLRTQLRQLRSSLGSGH
jgi:F-type H+-transporting ATPase subunit delta